MKLLLRIMAMPLVMLCFLTSQIEAQSYSITQLGTFGGPNGTEATALNDAGKAVGWSSKGDLQLPFLSSGHSIRSVGSLGGDYGVALGVNSSSAVVGGSYTSQRETHAFLWKPGSGMQDLGTLGGSRSQAQGVNRFGQIAGWSDRSDGATHAIYLADGVTMQDIGTLGGTFSQAFALNDSGQVVGWSDPSSTGAVRAFLWTQGAGMQDLGTLGGSGATALAINSSGHVVGNSLMAGDLTVHAFLWSKSNGMQDLGALPGGDHSVAYGINAAGTVVGAAATIPGGIGDHAFVWTKTGGMKDLNNLIPTGTGWFLAQAAAINKSGQITGWGTVNNGPAQGFVLTPVGSTAMPR
jgi:probable HAF family extracellular repeat protein